VLSIEKLKEIDPGLSHLSDADVEEIRDSMYEAAQLAFEVYWSRKYGSKYQVGSFTPSENEATL
jgi:hypothetical protein